MNRDVKKITEGAMLVAIIGVILFVNRQFAGFLGVYFLIILPIPLIVYGVRVDKKYLLIATASVFFLALIFNSGLMDLSYAAIACVIAYVYTSNFKKHKNKGVLLLKTILIAVFAELVISFLLAGIMGIDIKASIQYMLDSVDSVLATSNSSMEETFGSNFYQIVLLLYCLGLVLSGIIEGLLVHVISNILLKRLGLEYLAPTPLNEVKIPNVLAYLMYLSIFAYMLFYAKITNVYLQYLLIVVFCISLFTLVTLGFIGFISLGMIKYKKNLAGLLIILTIFLYPVMIPALLIMGFIYNTTNFRQNIIQKKE